MLAVLLLCVGTHSFGQNRTIRKLVRKAPRISVSKPGQLISNDKSGDNSAKFITGREQNKDSLNSTAVQTSWEDMKKGIVMSYNLNTVTVVSKSRRVAERNGKVNIDFVVSVPKKMIDNNWLVDINPRLSRSGDSSVIALGNLHLYGRKFRKKQLNGYNRYQRFLNSIKGDSLDFLRAFTNKRLYDITLERKAMYLEQKNTREDKKQAKTIWQEERFEERFRHYNRYPAYSMHKRGIPGVKSGYEKLHYLGLSTRSDILPVNYMIRDANKYHHLNFTTQVTEKELSDIDSLYWQNFYTRYGEIHRNEWLKDQKEERFARYVKFPINNLARLDSIVDDGKDFNYYYSQDILINENSRKLFLNVGGRVINTGGAEYRIPDTDTITYYVSSLVQFADHAPRFRKKVIERKAIANTFANITFEKNKNTVLEEIGDNKAQLQHIREIIRKLDESGEFVLDSITVTASSSPEGSWAHNAELAGKRAQTLAAYFSGKQNEDTRLSNFIKSRSIPENWDYLQKLIAEDEKINNKTEILQLIRNESNPDRRELKLRNLYPLDYTYMVANMYPKLRNIHFSFDMHRRGMVKDTIQTTEPDIEYAQAVTKMEERKYKEALTTLINYSDRNTAICYMSMGYEDAAMGILLNEQEDADSQYLLSVIYARKGNNDRAVKHFLRSVELDSTKISRGALDPEINGLIEMYNLNEKLFK